MGEVAEVVQVGGPLDHLPRELEGVLVAALPEARLSAGAHERDLDPASLDGVRDRRRRLLAAGVPAQRLGVCALFLAQQTLLEHQRCELRRWGEATRARERRLRLLEPSRERADLCQRPPHGARARGSILSVRATGERAAIELRGLDVGEFLLGALAGEQGVAPRPLGVVGEREMQ